MARSLRRSVNLFVLLTLLCAVAGLAYDTWVSLGRGLVGPYPVAFAVFAVCCSVTELRPLRWLRLDEGGQVTASWMFMMALLLIAPPITAISTASAIVLAGDMISRKSLSKIAFNSGQMVVCLSLAAAELSVAGQGYALVARSGPPMLWFPVFVVAAATVFALNNALTGTVMALHQGLKVSQMLRTVGRANLSTDGVLLSLAPILVVVSERSVFLVPLLLVTTWTVYRTAEMALVHRHEATHDALTQLPNRRLFDEHLHSAVTAAQRTGNRVGVILIDLNGFKGINDRLGHDIGDQILRSIATRMNSVRRGTDLLARIGGDEFAVVVTHLDSVAVALQVAERMQAAFRQPCVVEGFPVLVEASFGVAVLPDHAYDSETLLQRADETMYSAKQGEKRVILYSPKPDERAIGRIGLIGDVAQALAANEFFVEYQPQVSLLSGRTVGVEALVRWRHPVLGVLYPTEFIGLAEQTELIGQITEYVMQRALAQCALWQLEDRHLRIAVNISARNLQDVRFPELVARLLRESDVLPSDLDLEITENTVGLDGTAIHWVLTRLRAIGVSISIDDFGTGYSSMAQLRELPVDRIKIDRSFVTNMANTERDRLIVKAIVQLGQALEIETIAEGVEDVSVANMLLDFGCTAAQGWHYGKAMPPDRLSERLRSFEPPLIPDLAFERDVARR